MHESPKFRPFEAKVKASMSYRELRNFTEIMRALGYPRLISMENFRTPNFELVADTLFWLVHRYDPSIAVVDEIGTEQERVNFLKTIVPAMAGKSGIRLNAKKLYGADGYAVRELLKIASVLHDAVKVANAARDDDGSAPPVNALGGKLHDVKRARQLTSEITGSGATLFDLLNAEQESREARNHALSKPLDLVTIESSVNDSVLALQNSIDQMQQQMGELGSDEKDLEQRIEKKKQELERSKKRLESLQAVRPQFMDEYEKLEVEMSKLYSTYVENFRNLGYLEHELDMLNQEELEKIEERDRVLKAMQSKLKEEERKILRGDGVGDFDEDGRRRARAVGDMRGNGIDDNDSEDDSGSLGSHTDSGEISLDDGESEDERMGGGHHRMHDTGDSGLLDEDEEEEEEEEENLDGDESDLMDDPRALQHMQRGGRGRPQLDESDELSDNEF